MTPVDVSAICTWTLHAARRIRLYAGNPTILEEETLDPTAFTQFRATPYRGPDKQIIEEETTRCEGTGLAIHWRCGTREGERAEIHVKMADRRTVGGDDLLEQTPAGETRNATLMNELGGHWHITRKRIAINQQNPIAFSGGKHSKCAAGASRTHNDRIVHGSLLRSLWGTWLETHPTDPDVSGDGVSTARCTPGPAEPHEFCRDGASGPGPVGAPWRHPTIPRPPPQTVSLQCPMMDRPGTGGRSSVGDGESHRGVAWKHRRCFCCRLDVPRQRRVLRYRRLHAPWHCHHDQDQPP